LIDRAAALFATPTLTAREVSDGSCYALTTTCERFDVITEPVGKLSGTLVSRRIVDHHGAGQHADAVGDGPLQLGGQSRSVRAASDVGMAERGHDGLEFRHRDFLAAEVIDPAQQRDVSGHASIMPKRETHRPAGRAVSCGVRRHLCCRRGTDQGGHGIVD
jgi:hypothetical protein